MLIGSAGVAAADCGPGVLGTARTIVLKREFAAYGKAQHQALPLKPGEVVLTFDDGPRLDTTPRVLDALASECVRATFFMVGNALTQHPDLARKVAAAGHSTGLHSHTHPHMASLSAAEQLDDLKKAEAAYVATFGVSTPAYRFPFLEETPTLMAALQAKQITVASVDLGIDDWLGEKPEVLAARLAERLRANGGGIILMHDVNENMAQGMPLLLKVLKDGGYRVVHVEWEK